MNTKEQQAQRNKLIELATNWAENQQEYIIVLERQIFDSGAACEKAEAAEQAFRDYVEHMHDEVKA